MASPALAQDPPGNNGTIKVHDNNPGEPDPVVKNQPQVCEFDLHFFFADANQSGDWWIQSWPPNPDARDVVLSSDTEGQYMTDANGEDRKPDNPSAYYDQLADGHYKLFWEGRNGQNIKHKVFWVDCPEEVGGGGNGGGGNGGGGNGGGGNGGGGNGGQVPRGDVLGGSGGPGGGQLLPDTATGGPDGRVAALIAVLGLASVAAATVRTRRTRLAR